MTSINPTPKPELLTVREVANFLRIRPETVRRMIAQGELQAIRFGLRGDFRIPRKTLAKILDPVDAADSIHIADDRS